MLGRMESVGGVPHPQLVFDATFLVRRQFVRPTGIDRVQLEVVDELLRRADDLVTLVQFDDELNVYRVVPPASARYSVDRMRGLSERQQERPLPAAPRSSRIHRACGLR
jgi:hypothetical protein